MYKIIYNFLRKSKTINFLFHKTTQGKLINNIPLYVWFYKKLINKRAKQWMYHPPFLEITLTDKCNASCVMCPPAIHSGNTILKRSLFEKVVKEASKIGIKKMILTGGEPLLDSDVFDKIKFAKRMGFEYIHLFTNGQLLNRNNSVKLVNSGLDSLTVSIDSVIKEEYERIRKGLNFETVMKNIKEFKKIRKELNSQTPIFRLNRVNISINKKSSKDYINKLDTYADIVELMDVHNFGSENDKIFTEGTLYKQSIRYPCNLIFQKVIISPTGFYKKCSIDYTSDNAILGNCQDISLEDIINSKYSVIKKRLLKYDFSLEGCRTCTHKQSWWIDWNIK